MYQPVTSYGSGGNERESGGGLAAVVMQLRRWKEGVTKSPDIESNVSIKGSGDIISPKDWSYRRLWVTGSGYVGKAKPSTSEVNAALKARVARLETRLQVRGDLLAAIREIAKIPILSE